MRPQLWIFTFAGGHEYPGRYVRVAGTHDEARDKMIDHFGLHWAFQYSEEEWERINRRLEHMIALETEIIIPGLSYEEKTNDNSI